MWPGGAELCLVDGDVRVGWVGWLAHPLCIVVPLGCGFPTQIRTPGGTKLVTTYQMASRHLLAQARTELAAGDVRQASEKGWGAAAQMVKAIAEQRGWRHRGHSQLFDVVDDLRAETRDREIRALFDVASALHANFYEDWRSAANVAEGLDDVERLLDKLEPLIR